jgi:hypothetical protein
MYLRYVNIALVKFCVPLLQASMCERGGEKQNLSGFISAKAGKKVLFFLSHITTERNTLFAEPCGAKCVWSGVKSISQQSPKRIVNNLLKKHQYHLLSKVYI